MRIVETPVVLPLIAPDLGAKLVSLIHRDMERAAREKERKRNERRRHEPPREE